MTNIQNQQIDLPQQLEALRSELLDAQEKLKTAETEIQAGQGQIKTIEELINKRTQIVEDYSEAYPRLEAQQSEYNEAYENEKKCLDNILNREGREKVCCIVKKELGDIEKLEAEIKSGKETLNGSCTKENLAKCIETHEECWCDDGKLKALDKEKLVLEEKKKIYELWTDPIKSIEARHKILGNLKKEIDKEHTEGHHAYAYYLLNTKSEASFCHHLNDVPQVIKPDELKTQLKKAWNDYMKADECFNDINAEVKSCEKQLETRQAQLEEDKKNLEGTIQRRLNNYIDDECVIPPDCVEKEPDPYKKNNYGNDKINPT